MRKTTAAGLLELGLAWLAAVVRHRAEHGCYGGVKLQFIETPEQIELHMVEETTFRASDECPDPLAAAREWVARQTERRRQGGVSGSCEIKHNDRRGRVTFARVIETTVVGPPTEPTATGCGPPGGAAPPPAKKPARDS